MKKLLCAVALLTACGTQEVRVIKGPKGDPGQNGYSLVSYVAKIPAGLLCVAKGSSMDFYLDLDYSLDFSKDDKYQGSLVVCNGANGLAGSDGSDGLAGTDGAQGIPGEQGPSGLDGEDGEDGQNGHNGENGHDGNNGENGHDGNNGVDGIDGHNGQDGNDGVPGENGHDGSNGQDGHDGADGQNGHDGSNGQNGLNGETGPAGAPGQNGADGSPGHQGPSGPQGVTGPMGQAGQDGEDGTLVTITEYSSSTCTAILGTTYYAKNGKVYTAGTCSGQDVGISQGESMWLSATKLAITTSNSVRVITFN